MANLDCSVDPFVIAYHANSHYYNPNSFGVFPLYAVAAQYSGAVIDNVDQDDAMDVDTDYFVVESIACDTSMDLDIPEDLDDAFVTATTDVLAGESDKIPADQNDDDDVVSKV